MVGFIVGFVVGSMYVPHFFLALPVYFAVCAVAAMCVGWRKRVNAHVITTDEDAPTPTRSSPRAVRDSTATAPPARPLLAPARVVPAAAARKPIDSLMS